MTKTLLRSGVLTACVFAASTASAQVQPPPPPVPGQPATAQPATAQAATQYRAKQVLGTRILIQGDTAVGTVDDIVFDAAGNLEYLIVASDGKLTTVPFEAAKFDLAKQTAVIPLTMEQYRRIPTYTVTTYPSFYTPTYRTEVYRYYNLTPRELRRIGGPVIVRP